MNQPHVNTFPLNDLFGVQTKLFDLSPHLYSCYFVSLLVCLFTVRSKPSNLRSISNVTPSSNPYFISITETDHLLPLRSHSSLPLPFNETLYFLLFVLRPECMFFCMPDPHLHSPVCSSSLVCWRESVDICWTSEWINEYQVTTLSSSSLI